MFKQNLHTHSLHCDGNDTVEEMVQEAISKNFDVLGFSGHGYCSIDDYSMPFDEMEKYIQDVRRVKEKYKDQISVYLGIEQDVLGMRFEKNDPFDYIIGSVHFVEVADQFIAVDMDKKTTEKIVELCGDFLTFAKVYYDEVKKIANMDEVDIVGHIDLLTKFNEDESFICFDDPEYLSWAKECIDTLIAADKIFEVNTGAIARGYRKTPYPQKLLLEYINQKGGKILLNSDCHNRFKLDCGYKESLDLIKNCGFKSMMEFNGKKFISKDLEEFGC